MHNLKQYHTNLSLLTIPVKSTEAVTVLILCGAGSRYETKNINGISHYLEHMFFKGGKKYTTGKEVSSAIDSIGGEMNAFTGKEYAGYYIKTAKEQIETSIDVLSDMLLHAQFRPEEINRERGVILEEYNMYQDTPMYQVLWDFERLVFGDQPLGWDEVGLKTFIENASQKDFQTYKHTLYTPDNIVISIAGNFDQKEVEEYIQHYFGQFVATKGKEFEPFKTQPQKKNVWLTNKKTEQAHIVLGVEGLDYHNEKKYALKLLSTILGGNMSSRMFQRIREEKGLAYYVQTSHSDYFDTGVVYTRAGVSLNDVYDAIKTIREEYETIKKEPVTQEELKRAKEYLKGKMVLNFEDSENVAHFYGEKQLLTKKIETPEERKKKIDAVSIQDVLSLSQELFEKKLNLSVIGPFEEEGKFEKLLK